MRMTVWVAAAALLIGGCDRAAREQADNAVSGGAADGAAQDLAGWDLVSSGEGVALVLGAADAPAVRLYCPATNGEILVNVPAFDPVGSEERMSFGSGGEVVALVADTRGDAKRGGVTGEGPVPDNLSALIGGPVAVNYGAQNSGPHPAPPPQLAQAFVAACGESAGENELVEPAPEAAGPIQAGACRMQDGERIPANRLKGIGTEPFWGVRIDGRCVTYSTPEDQDGTRVWTAFAGTRDRGTWTGYLDKQRFVLRTRPQPGCSDGMSDNRYPIAVTLTVRGEERTGCAEPL